MKPEQILEAEKLMDVSNRFAKRAGLAAKKELQQRFMGQYRNARLHALIGEKGVPSIMPVGLALQQRSAQTWLQVQAEWLLKNPVK